ncbi:DUF3253 domain-containing protein [Albimonas sp. CAU 1670]|uniref:DUF3253 domain-containing protein n=1 Tax=Albimonas sp. CAU 1670 TaxID=3032599 RepID=UPI0023DC59C3|nr:DUF3253 domain-containing protein [Albimonas sp. CAU 1670]MDF2231445.1 DUF3253 domain-containing protein [Albimonas sp. CAU 1670]
MNTTDDRIAETLLELARSPEAVSGFCPSEAARRLAPDDWRPLVDRVRMVASRLQRDGLISVTQSGKAVDALSAQGPIRLSRPLH